MDVIASVQNQRVKDAVKLRDSRQRRKQGRFIIDGAREIRRAVEAGVELIELFLCEPLAHTDQCRETLERLSALPIERSQVTPAVFEKLAFGQRAEGIVAVARTPHRTLDDLQLPACPLIAVLEGVEKPGNIGAVLRTADTAGVSALIVADGGTDLYNPNTIRASLGTLFTVPVCAAATLAARDWLTKQKIRLFAARLDASIHYTDVDLAQPAAIVLGSEAVGLSDAWSGPEVTPIRIPMRGTADSLNVSAAAAVLFYEALRQRGGKSEVGGRKLERGK